MTTRTTKAAAIGVLAAALAITLAYSAMILPASAQAQTSNSTTSNTSTSTLSGAPPQAGGQGWGPFGGAPMRGPFRGSDQQQVNVTVGQTITFTSTSGKYVVVGNHDQNGTASGTLTFTVTGKLAGGYTLSISSGSIVANGNTYTVSSGSAQMGRGAARLVGQGATSPSGEFLVTATAHGSFVGTTATMSLDLGSGSTEYLVFLSGTA